MLLLHGKGSKMDAGSAVLSGVAILISLAAWWEARKSRQIAKDAAKSSQISAEAATMSAGEATKLTEIESGRLNDEREELHKSRGPINPGEIVARLEMDGSGHSSLFGSITLTRDYRVQAQGWTGTALTPISGLPLLLHAHKSYEFHIEHWPKGREKQQTQEIRFKLWPPIAELDDADPWTCPCDRPTGEKTDGPGHWEMRVAVKPQTIPLKNIW